MIYLYSSASRFFLSSLFQFHLRQLLCYVVNVHSFEAIPLFVQREFVALVSVSQKHVQTLPVSKIDPTLLESMLAIMGLLENRMDSVA